MHEHIATPHFPAVVLAFDYRGMQVEITTSYDQGRQVYSAWVGYPTGSAVAVPRADSREGAIARAKKWINTQFNWPTSALPPSTP